MKLKISAIICCLCLVCFAIAQQIVTPVDSSSFNAPVYQRHANADAVLAVVNINRDNKPIVLQHYDDAETAVLAKEMSDALKIENMSIKSVEAYNTIQPTDNPKHYNFTFQMTDTVLYLKVHPRQKH